MPMHCASVLAAVMATAAPSRGEWEKGKGQRGWQWLLPIIDANKDGRIDPKEYAAFQAYKARNPDWAKGRKGQKNVPKRTSRSET